MKRMTYRIKELTVNEFINMENIDADPAHQRPQVQDKNKRTGIIETMMDGYDTGEIKLNEFEADTDEGPITSLEVIDGSNRLRSIRQFYNNKFSIFDKVFYKDLTSDEQTIFLDYALRFTIYENLTAPVKAKQFITTNTITKVNHPEKMNAFGVIPIASLIRQYVRQIPSTDTVPNELFDCRKLPSEKINYRFFQFDNAGLTMEDNVARIAYLCDKDEGLVPHGDALIWDMYKKEFSEKEIEALDKKIVPVLNFIKKCAYSRIFFFKKGLQKNEFICLYRLYFHLESIYGKNFTIKDYEDFFNDFKLAFDSFSKYNPTRKEEISLGKDKEQPVYILFQRSLTNHEANSPKSMVGCTQAIKWLLEEFDNIDDYITPPKGRRLFTIAEKETQLLRQKFKCKVDGLPLKIEDTHGAHIISVKNGGETVPENLWATRAIHNLKMGQQNAREYKKEYLKTLVEAS